MGSISQAMASPAATQAPDQVVSDQNRRDFVGVQCGLEIRFGARAGRAEAMHEDLAPGPRRAGPEWQAFDAARH